MKSSVCVFDPTESDTQSKVRGIGRYLQILKENFPDWTFSNDLSNFQTFKPLNSVFINPFFNFLLTPLVMKRIAHKQIAVIHDLIPLKYPDHFPIGIRGKLNIFLNKLALKNYDRIITDSEASKSDIIKILGIKESKITVIYPCLPKIFIGKNNALYSILNSPFCLYVGDATWNKNLVNLAKALKIINVTCIFVGKVFEKTTSLDHPWQKEFKLFLEEIKDDKRFILKGYVSDEDLIGLYKNSQLNILPSRDEGFGFSYFEAASQMCPSVLADINVLHEISDNNAMFANPNDPHALADAIGELYFHKETRNAFGQKANKRQQQFSPTEFKKQFLSAITL